MSAGTSVWGGGGAKKSYPLNLLPPLLSDPTHVFFICLLVRRRVTAATLAFIVAVAAAVIAIAVTITAVALVLLLATAATVGFTSGEGRGGGCGGGLGSSFQLLQHKRHRKKKNVNKNYGTSFAPQIKPILSASNLST